EQQEREPEQDELLLELEQLKRGPIPVSRFTEAHFLLLELSPQQIRSFREYCSLFGFPTDKYELQAIPYWDIALIKKLLPYLDFSPQSAFPWRKNSAGEKEEQQLLFRTSRVLEESKGFQPDSTGKSRYQGSPQRLFIRYTAQFNRVILAGFGLEKDAGEMFGRTLKRTADFIGFHVFFRGLKNIKAIALGDYTINAGQGLLIWQGMAFGKGADGAGVFRQGAVLKPYRSAGEINFFRGAAIQLAKGKWETVSWVSKRKRSATLRFDGQEPVSFSSFSESGYHRTSTELAARNRLTEFVAGSILRYQGKGFRLNVNNLYQHYSLPWMPREEPYNQYYFRGKTSVHQSIDYTVVKKQFFLFGEIAKGGKGWAVLQGIIASLDSKMDGTLVIRHFQPGYHSYYANALAEQAAIRNEEGIYSSVVVRPDPRWRLNFYVDFYRFPWLRFRIAAPSGGREARVQLQWQKKRSWLVYGIFRTRSGMENLSGLPTYSIVPVVQHNLRVHLEKNLPNNWHFSARLDQVWFKKEGVMQTGTGMYADLKGPVSRLGWQLAGRLHWFQTDGYSSRIYSYERDLLYSYSIPAFFDHGWRYYLQWQGRLKPSFLGSVAVKWWLRWSHTGFTNKNSSGSGWDEIQGNKRSEWKFQVMLNW
ncbi:hypothetical protein, partial [Flavihumibacter sp. CACIAM 22H1]|uniref:hypothetical protein n=1 Tax=Flavihumibacter sp. CACIAM 22H1 TaxID=1812911 RepID=UPI0007A81A79